jgi:hypothetical protein
METLIIKPANKEEAKLLKVLIQKMNVKFAVISDEDKEDYALTKAMLIGKKSKPVSETSIMKKLKS